MTDDIVAIENSTDVNVLASRNTGQGAMLKFAAVTRAIRVIDRFTLEPSGARLPVIPDLMANCQLPTEVSSVNHYCSVQQTLLGAPSTAPRRGVTQELAQPFGSHGCPRGKFCACAAPFPVSTRGVHA